MLKHKHLLGENKKRKKISYISRLVELYICMHTHIYDKHLPSNIYIYIYIYVYM